MCACVLQSQPEPSSSGDPDAGGYDDVDAGEPVARQGFKKVVKKEVVRPREPVLVDSGVHDQRVQVDLPEDDWFSLIHVFIICSSASCSDHHQPLLHREAPS